MFTCVFRRSLLSVVVIIAATFLAYLPAMRNSFVWDDTALVLRDPLIRHWRLVPDGFRQFLFLDATASNFYRPIQRLTFTADYALWGIRRAEESATRLRTNAPDTGDQADTRSVLATPQPGWHLTSVLIHALAAVALWAFLRIWLGKGSPLWPLAGAVLWAIHPLHTSAITYVSGRADPLAALFVFSALALIAKAHSEGGFASGNRAAARAVIGAAVCCLLALLSKESGVAGLTLWLVWVLGKARKSAAAWVVFGVGAMLVTGVYFSLRNTADKTPPPVSTKTTTIVQRAGLVTRAAAEYTQLFVAPQKLHMERDITEKPITQAIAGGFILAGFFAWAAWARRRRPDAALALACAAVAWGPVSNAFTLNATMAEHWFYIPSAFLIAALVFTARCTGWRWVPVAAAVWAVFLAAQTWTQQGYWKDQRTFFTQTIERAGRGKRMLGNLAGLELDSGKIDAAKSLIQEAQSLDPKFTGLRLMKAGIALSEKDFAAAEEQISIVEKDPFFAAETRILRSQLYFAKTGKPRFDFLADAASTAPRNWSMVRAYPLALEALGKPQDAYAELLRSITALDIRAEPWRDVARVAETLKDFPVALRAYGEAANRDCRDDYSRARIRELSGVQ
jgi:hypothetical protein